MEEMNFQRRNKLVFIVSARRQNCGSGLVNADADYSPRVPVILLIPYGTEIQGFGLKSRLGSYGRHQQMII